MKPTLPLAAVLLLTAVVAVAFRTADLAVRPMHADEAVQAAIARHLWLQGNYEYFPEEFHGPTLPYATLPVLWLSDASTFAETTETTFRIVPACFGVALVLLLWCFADAVGRPAACSAALLAAVSPAFVYYSRYFIHETPLALFTLYAILAGWRYLRSGRLAWCLAAGVAVGLAQATKETAPLAYFAAAVALAATWGLSQFSRRENGTVPFPDSNIRLSHLALAAAALLAVVIVLYSSFFTNARGPLDALLTYLPWLERAGGHSPHVNPWYFFLQRFAWWQLDDGPLFSELLILLLAAVGFTTSLLPKGRVLEGANIHFVRWLGFYTVVLTIIYSIIPYKTPWCALQFLLPMTLLAGVGAVALIRLVPTVPLKTITALALLAATAQLAHQSHRAAFLLPASPQNPYVFAHTSPGILDLEEIVEQLAASSPAHHATPIQIVWHDVYYWPLPWYLRRFEHVEPWTAMPPSPNAPIILCSPAFDAEMEAAVGTETSTPYYYQPYYHELRPQVLIALWIHEDLWQAHLERQGEL